PPLQAGPGAGEQEAAPAAAPGADARAARQPDPEQGRPVGDHARAAGRRVRVPAAGAAGLPAVRAAVGGAGRRRAASRRARAASRGRPRPAPRAAGPRRPVLRARRRRAVPAGGRRVPAEPARRPRSGRVPGRVRRLPRPRAPPVIGAGPLPRARRGERRRPRPVRAAPPPGGLRRGRRPRRPRLPEVITTVALGDGVGAAFTGRAGGVSTAPYDTLNLGGAVGDDPAAVRDNRRRAAAALGVDPGRVVFMRQVHGADVAFADSPDLPEPVDAVVTTVPGLALAALVADCAPVLLADPAAGVVGAAHSGRPGTAAGVVPALVKAMREHGADPARTTAAIGPAACGRCYEVPARMRDEGAAAVPAAYCTTSKGTPGLDIRAGIAEQLAAEGVT